MTGIIAVLKSQKITSYDGLIGNATLQRISNMCNALQDTSYDAINDYYVAVEKRMITLQLAYTLCFTISVVCSLVILATL